jgi:hypothetical protein
MLISIVCPEFHAINRNYGELRNSQIMHVHQLLTFDVRFSKMVHDQWQIRLFCQPTKFEKSCLSPTNEPHYIHANQTTIFSENRISEPTGYCGDDIQNT